jgi:hypothetical protein
MSFTAPYPYVFLILWLTLSAGISYFLYRNNPLNLTQKWLRNLLYVFRFTSIFVILFLLLGPLFNLKIQRTEKPVVAVLVDNSFSMLYPNIEAEKTKNVISEIVKMQEKLGDNYLVKTYTFGESTQSNGAITFSEKQSNLAQAIKQVSEEHYNLNLSGIVLLSDGIYNSGESPLYEAIQQKQRIYPIAFGDSARRKDVFIKQVKHNEVVFEGNSFAIQALVSANYFNNTKLNYGIYENNRLLVNGSVTILGDPANEVINLTLPSATEGLHTYQLKLQNLPGEINFNNNTYTFQIESLKSKQKVVVIAQHPHPDISALVQTVKSNPNFEVYSYLLQDYKEEHLNDASLFILHQLPGNNGSGENLIKSLQQKNKSCFYILGKQSSSAALSKFGIINISGPGNNFNETQAWVNDNFSLFTLDASLQEFLSKAPPLISLYGNYRGPADASVLLNQQIGYVKTSQPLLFFSGAAGAKMAVLAGEGYWKWRLHDFLLNQNQQLTQGLLFKIIQFTAGNSDQSRFRINPIKKQFNEIEPILFEAELYNPSYELIQDKEISLEIKSANGKSYQFNLSKNGKSYELNAGKIGPGSYTYEAKVLNSTEYPIKKGRFSVNAVQLELVQTKADHALLLSMANESGGKLFYPEQSGELIETLKQDSQMKPIVYEEESIELLLGYKWLLAFIVGLLSLEWLIRKWNGFI